MGDEPRAGVAGIHDGECWIRCMDWQHPLLQLHIRPHKLHPERQGYSMLLLLTVLEHLVFTPPSVCWSPRSCKTTS